MEYPKQVRCIKAVSSFYTEGKIYDVDPSGRIIDNYGGPTSHVYNTTTLNPDGDRFPMYSDFELVGEEKVMETQKLSREGLKEIHSVACSSWKIVLESCGSRNPLENYVELTQIEVDKMFAACTKEQLPIVSKYLKQDDGSIDVIQFRGDIYDKEGRSAIQKRFDGEYKYKSFYLDSMYNWEIKNDSSGILCLIPTKKK